MLPAGGVRVNGVRTTDRWACPDCAHTAVTLNGCGWGCTLPVVGGLGLMTLMLLARGLGGDSDGACAGALGVPLLAFFAWMISARLRDARENPPI